jgi:hypothetical protein
LRLCNRARDKNRNPPSSAGEGQGRQPEEGARARRTTTATRLSAPEHVQGAVLGRQGNNEHTSPRTRALESQKHARSPVIYRSGTVRAFSLANKNIKMACTFGQLTRRRMARAGAGTRAHCAIRGAGRAILLCAAGGPSILTRSNLSGSCGFASAAADAVVTAQGRTARCCRRPTART